jgi:hypothetical protein
LTEVSIQLEEKGGSRGYFVINSDQKFYFRFYAHFTRPLKTRAVFHYTVFSDTGKWIDDSDDVDLPGRGAT